jgi:RNA polymerase sigma factor (sigma-70 family)
VTTKPLVLEVQHLRRSALRQDGAARTDAELLEAFLRGRDGLALEVLVRRHAPMVWGVCRRALAHHDAEDAFQATFLVLVRKAASIHSRELLPNWLYRVACQTARKARQRAAKRCAREKQVRVMPEPPRGPHDDGAGPELRALLDEELSRLPEKYRVAVVLCDVEGSTRHDAARQLHLPVGTVASRLERGRALLARRLLKRGLGASATALAAAGLQQAASGAVPAALLTRTIKAVNLPAAGEAVTAGLIGTEVAPLAEGVLRGMAAAKRKAAGAWLALAAVVLAGGVAAHQTLAALMPAGGTATSHTLAARRPRLALAYLAVGEMRRFPVEECAWSVSFSPDGRRVLIGVGGVGVPVRVCDVNSGQEVLRTDPYNSCWSAVYSPDGKSIAVGFGAQPILILDAQTGKVCRELAAKAIGARNVIFSPDGRLIASSHADDRLRVWDVAQGRLLHVFPAKNGAVHGAVFTPDGNFLLIIDPSATLRLYEVGSGQEVRRLEGHTDRVTDVAVSADGRRALSCSLDKTVRLWDLQTGEELRRMVGHDACVHGVAFCSDGYRALSGSYDNTLRLRDLRTGRQLHRFDGHQGAVCCVAVSSDGRHALSGSADRTVRLWRLPPPGSAPGQ